MQDDQNQIVPQQGEKLMLNAFQIVWNRQNSPVYN